MLGHGRAALLLFLVCSTLRWMDASWQLLPALLFFFFFFFALALQHAPSAVCFGFFLTKSSYIENLSIVVITYEGR
jgi:hypothetical protein